MKNKRFSFNGKPPFHHSLPDPNTRCLDVPLLGQKKGTKERRERLKAQKVKEPYSRIFIKILRKMKHDET
jgi:hypothetical protein